PPGNIVAESGGLTGDKVGGVYSTTTSGIKFWRTTNGGLTFTQTNPSAGTSTDTGQGFPVVGRRACARVRLREREPAVRRTPELDTARRRRVHATDLVAGQAPGLRDDVAGR